MNIIDFNHNLSDRDELDYTSSNLCVRIITMVEEHLIDNKISFETFINHMKIKGNKLDKWMNFKYNFTLREIAKIEMYTGLKIINHRKTYGTKNEVGSGKQKQH